jgi:hypothetical protein
MFVLDIDDVGNDDNGDEDRPYDNDSNNNYSDNVFDPAKKIHFHFLSYDEYFDYEGGDN